MHTRVDSKRLTRISPITRTRPKAEIFAKSQPKKFFIAFVFNNLPRFSTAQSSRENCGFRNTQGTPNMIHMKPATIAHCEFPLTIALLATHPNPETMSGGFMARSCTHNSVLHESETVDTQPFDTCPVCTLTLADCVCIDPTGGHIA